MRFSKRPYRWLLVIMAPAQATFDKLSRVEKQTVFRQLTWLLVDENPAARPTVEMLKAKQFERAYRVRAGDYRLLFALEAAPVTQFGFAYKGTLFLLDIRKRADAYR